MSGPHGKLQFITEFIRILPHPFSMITPKRRPKYEKRLRDKKLGFTEFPQMCNNQNEPVMNPSEEILNLFIRARRT